MKKGIKIIFGSFIIIGAVLAVNKVLSYALIDDVNDEVRYAMHELYEQEDIETLFWVPRMCFAGMIRGFWTKLWERIPILHLRRCRRWMAHIIC